jgi:hypothetical protein
LIAIEGPMADGLRPAGGGAVEVERVGWLSGVWGISFLLNTDHLHKESAGRSARIRSRARSFQQDIGPSAVRARMLAEHIRMGQ